jgi:hypothetical protein
MVGELGTAEQAAWMIKTWKTGLIGLQSKELQWE